MSPTSRLPLLFHACWSASSISRSANSFEPAHGLDAWASRFTSKILVLARGRHSNEVSVEEVSFFVGLTTDFLATDIYSETFM